MLKVLVLSPEAKDSASRKRRQHIVAALGDLETKLLNPIPGRPPEKQQFFPSLLPQVFYQKEVKVLSEADLVIADLTQPDFKTGFLVSQALIEEKPVLGLFWQEIKREKLAKWQTSENLYVDCFDKENVRSVLRHFLEFIKEKRRQWGKFVVFEGTDGSGKETQAKLLVEYLKKTKIATKYIDFPRYYSSFHGGTVGRYLKGEFGGMRDVNPYLASLAYALDRLTAKQEIEDWLKGGILVVANRYVSSNLGHQTARIPKKERENFINWLVEMEYKVHKIPKEDLVIFLHVPVEVASALIENKKKRKYTGKRKKDVQEENLDHQKKSEKMYLQLVDRFDHWEKIDCVNQKGRLLPRKKIHQKILKLLKEKRILDKE